MSSSLPPRDVPVGAYPVVAREGSLSGLTDLEAKEFHKIFVFSFIVFTLIAIVAHFLVWSWRPWIPGPSGYTMLTTHGHTALALATSAFT